MSRLDSFIRRMQAQRACIDFAAQPGALPPGPVFELGLGNGRTYDHLRARFPEREIFVFDREIRAHPSCIPDANHVFLGELAETLPRAAMRFAAAVAFVHADLGSGDAAANRAAAAGLAPHIAELVAAAGLVASDQAFHFAGWDAPPLPPGVDLGRYFLYRRPRA
jgi:hypothetical protein